MFWIEFGEEMKTEAGIPAGAVTGLTATMQLRIVRWLYCVPAVAGKVQDPSAKYYLALRLSMRGDLCAACADRIDDETTQLVLHLGCHRHGSSPLGPSGPTPRPG